MPLKYIPRRLRVRRRRPGARRPLRRYKRVRRHNTGFLSIVRKASQITTYSTAGVAGAITKNDPTGTCLNLGTPVYIAGTDNCYDIPFSMSFRLSQLMNSGDITTLADAYKIVSALVKIHANWNFVGGLQTSAVPWVEYIQDHDDATVPAISDLREKMGTKNKYFNASKPTILMGVRPKFADSIFNNGVTTAYAVGNKREWINSTYGGVEHYGIKGVLHNVQLPGSGSGGTLFNWDVSLKVVAKDFQ